MDAVSFLSQYWWIIAILVGSVAAFWYFKPKKAKMNDVMPFPLEENAFRHQYERPDGGYILTRYPIPEDKLPEVMERAVRGLQRTIDASQAANPHWDKYTHTVNFDHIWMVEPHTRNQDGSPALIVYGQYQTAGTVWNTWGVAGQWLGNPYIVLPDQGHPDYGWRYMEYFEESVRNESEHAREWVNDYPTFIRFAIAGDVHPHWPEASLSGVSAPCCGIFSKEK